MHSPPRRLPRAAIAVTLGLALLLGVSTQSQARKRKKVVWYQYAVPFTCGDNATDSGRTLTGTHASAVRIFNPSGATATLYSGLALDFPTGMLIPGWSSSRIATTLPAGTATQASCQDALDLQAQMPPPPFAIPAYVQGFAVIQSSVRLQVQVTHSVEMSGGSVAMNSQAITPVAIAPPPAP